MPFCMMLVQLPGRDLVFVAVLSEVTRKSNETKVMYTKTLRINTHSVIDININNSYDLSYPCKNVSFHNWFQVMRLHFKT